MTFGTILDNLKANSEYKASRKGWNGKGMFIYMVKNWSGDVSADCDYEPLPFLAMKTVDNKSVPWLASQTDILAEDWEKFE